MYASTSIVVVIVIVITNYINLSSCQYHLFQDFQLH